MTPSPLPVWKRELGQRLARLAHPGTSRQAEAQRQHLLWLEEILRPDLFVTIQFNEALSIELARERLHVLGYQVERAWLGQRAPSTSAHRPPHPLRRWCSSAASARAKTKSANR